MPPKSKERLTRCVPCSTMAVTGSTESVLRCEEARKRRKGKKRTTARNLLVPPGCLPSVLVGHVVAVEVVVRALRISGET